MPSSPAMPSSAILIVDDNPTNLQVLSEALSIEGFQIAVATNGERALKQVRYRLPELILMDVMMPGIDGFEACRQLKSDPLTANVPVIFMTALVDTESKVKGFSLGAVDYITKPFQQEEVIARVRTHLQLQNFSRTLATQNTLLKQEIEQRQKAEAQLRQLTHDLEQTLHHLQQTQVQLIQSEKMSSLGQLVAGIAHEINNPMNFIAGNLIHASNHTQDLLTLLDSYQTCYPEPEPAVQQIADSIDVDFIKADLPKLIDSMKVGGNRIREIVTSLRIFSRLDEAEVKSADIHEGLDSTLMILQHRLNATARRPAIQVIKDYGNLPKIECYVGQLNQVFMHLLVNAVEALDAAISAKRNCEATAKQASCEIMQKTPDWIPTIWIQTRVLDSHWVEIIISDNGIGMSEEIRQRIFDPFFTTKPVGQGTGMGMSISYQIITQAHRGQLLCASTPTEKTEFRVQIPISQHTT